MNSAARRCTEAIRRVGGEAVLVQGGKRIPFSASIQPRLSGWEPDGDVLGTGCAEYFTMYTPCDAPGDIQPFSDVVEFREHRYHVLRAETMFLAGEPLYCWAVLRREVGAEG